MEKTVIPYKEKAEGKKVQVAEMFDNISNKYDFLNHLLSLGIDRTWRRKAINQLSDLQPKKILDIATGTGDLAIEALRLKPDEIIGVDISEGMLAVGKEKIKNKKLDHIIRLEKGDSENLPFEENFFDALVVAFGVRNFENLELGLRNMFRVVRPGGRAVILEFSNPTRFPMKQLYSFYSQRILPIVGKTVSKDSSAYTYLPESVKAFPYGNEFLDILKDVGFTKNKCIPLTFGICSVYVAEK